MLGRLGMTVDQCIRTYKSLAETAFTPKWPGLARASRSGTFSATKLQGAIKWAIRANCPEPECVAHRKTNIPTTDNCPHEDLQFYDEACTKTVILAITKANVEALPTLFTTYDPSTSLSGCMIWEVARATSAAIALFKPIKVGRDEVEFVDAGFGHNNPCETLIAEAEAKFPGRDMLILSIGTGLGDVVEIDDTGKSILKALEGMAASSKAAALRLRNRYSGTGKYFRFNVESGLKDVTLSDWKQTSKISSHTTNYLEENKVAIMEFVSVITRRGVTKAPTQPLELEHTTKVLGQSVELDGHRPVHCIPFYENPYFVGRQKLLDTLNDKLFTQAGFQQVALVGLGGMGKTQVALKLAYMTKKHKPGYSVFWITAASMAKFDDACKKLVEELDISKTDDEDPKILVKHHMESRKAGNWLLVLDNIDEIDIFGTPNTPTGAGIHAFLPRSERGRVLLTTRSNEVAWQIVKMRTSIIELETMSSKELTTILGRGVEDLDDQASINGVLEELCYLPLAVAQAADYMFMKSISVFDYLELLRYTQKDKIQLLGDGHSDETHHDRSQGAVATTWLITFEQVRRASQPAVALLHFIAQIDPKAIPQSIFPEFETKKEMADAVGMLLGYGFLRRQQTPGLFDMHSLVHLTTQLWCEGLKNGEEQWLDALEHVTQVFPDDEWENRNLWRLYLPHARRIIGTGKANSMDASDLAFKVGKCLLKDGHAQESVIMNEYVVAMEEKALAVDHPSLLAFKHNLAVAYLKNGQVEKAISVFKHVLMMEEKILAADHPYLLTSQHELARAYLDNGQAEQAISMLEYVVEMREETLEADDSELLMSQHELAVAHLNNNQVEKAIPMFEHVLVMQEKALAADHPSFLASQHNLAVAYLKNGQTKEALLTLERLLVVEQKKLGADHPLFLATQHELARVYLSSGQVAKAVSMFECLLLMEEKALVADHPSLLTSKHNLAGAYLDNGQVQKGVSMLEHVVGMRQRTLAVDHPKLLTSQHELARAYLANGQVEKAISMFECLLLVEERALEADHPSLLESQHELARVYLDNGQTEKAVPMFEYVVAMREKALAADHPSLLASQYELGRAYSTNA
ncbi:pyruvate kinase [Ceratocystis lukuohia]|uniref:Pyruvate kinase n=1 Tax=Ceratocystis lukuohia TaxID=2019550 RepID=A0ABR4MGY6_9PEZI